MKTKTPRDKQKTRPGGSLKPVGSAGLDVNDPDWSTLFALKLELMGRNNGCGPLEMLGRIMGCKRKAIRHARKIDRSWTKKGKPNK